MEIYLSLGQDGCPIFKISCRARRKGEWLRDFHAFPPRSAYYLDILLVNERNPGPPAIGPAPLRLRLLPILHNR
jgi:hypothetical protein